jgi:ribosome-associated protein
VENTVNNAIKDDSGNGAPDVMALLRTIGDAISDKQGRDVVVIDISAQSSFADYFVNATATNIRMLATLRDEVESRLASSDMLPRGIEGKEASGWVLMDYGDIIVNLFLEDQRNTYQIEKIWSDGTIIDIGE